MSANRTWQAWKTWITVVLGVLLAVDLGLGIFLWQASRQEPQALRNQRDHIEMQAKLFKADVARGQEIRASLPQVGKDCDSFYRESFLDAGTGYSAIEADLDQIARKSGLTTGQISFKQKEIKDRGVTEIIIGAEVQGGYAGVIQFVNGIERSKNFYLLRNLELQSGTVGGIRLQLELRTYFRT